MQNRSGVSINEKAERAREKSVIQHDDRRLNLLYSFSSSVYKYVIVMQLRERSTTPRFQFTVWYIFTPTTYIYTHTQYSRRACAYLLYMKKLCYILSSISL